MKAFIQITFIVVLFSSSFQAFSIDENDKKLKDGTEVKAAVEGSFISNQRSNLKVSKTNFMVYYFKMSWIIRLNK